MQYPDLWDGDASLLSGHHDYLYSHRIYDRPPKAGDTVFYAKRKAFDGGAGLGDAQLLWRATFLVQPSDPSLVDRHV